MTVPPLLRLALATLMIAITCGAGVRLGNSLRHGRHAETDADGLHILMGIAMAGMLEPPLSVLPTVAGQAAFTASAAWFGWKSLLASRAPTGAIPPHRVPLPHFVESLAMIYMLLPGTAATPGMTMPGTHHTGPGGSRVIIALLLSLSMVGYAIWAAATLTPSASPAGTQDRRTTPREPAGRGGGRIAPRLAAGYQIAMSITMGYMLIQLA